MTSEVALIVGVGSGLSASLAKLFAREGMRVALAARHVEKIKPLASEISAETFACDAGEPDQVAKLFDNVTAKLGEPTFVVFNAGARGRGSIVDLDPEQVKRGWLIGAFGGFLVGQQAAKRMLPLGRGTILFTGATASVKGFSGSAPFAMAKFSLRGLAQSMARELAPKGIHVAHVVIDGGISSSYAEGDADRASDRWLDPDAIAESYLQLHRQHRSAWTWELEVRPWLEKF
jgi:NAD(P)-dependent dehydrogenase (short-subunit alcohol dehydrogenase family)